MYICVHVDVCNGLSLTTIIDSQCIISDVNGSEHSCTNLPDMGCQKIFTVVVYTCNNIAFVSGAPLDVLQDLLAHNYP